MPNQDIQPIIIGDSKKDEQEHIRTYQKIDENFKDTSSRIETLESTIIAPAYDSGWTAVAANAYTTFTHNLGGDVDKYVVELTFKDTTGGGIGINNLGIGSFISGANAYGMYWQDLSTTIVKVWRSPQDTNEEARIRIWIHG